MKTRKIVLLAADLILLAVLIVQIVVSSIDPTKTFTLTESPDEVHIYTANKQIDMYFDGENWYLGQNKYPGNSVYIEDLISKLSKLHAVNKVGSVKNEAAIDRFELNEENCISVVAKKGGNLIRSIQIGKSPSGVQQVYATIDGQKDIYLVEGNLRTAFDYEEDYLRNKIIYEIPAESIKSVEYVEYTNNKGKITERRVQVPDDKKPSYALFTTDTFVVPEDLSKAVKKYTVTVNADKVITMDIYELEKETKAAAPATDVTNGVQEEAKPEYTYIGISSESPYKFSVPTYSLEKFASETEKTE